MARIFELLFIAFLLYLAFRRVVAPIQRGFQEREQERARARHKPETTTKLDRASARDAQFKDLPQ